MGKLANIARNISGSGGVYIGVKEIITDYPDGVTITGAFLLTYKGEQKGCFTFAEAPDKFFYAEAGDLKKIFYAWLRGCDGSIDALNDELNNEHVKLKIHRKNIGGGKTYTKAIVIESEEDIEVRNEVRQITRELPF